MVDKQFLVVAYDISSDKRRTKVAKVLEKYGCRSNFSVFECFLTPDQVTEMKGKLAKIIKPVSDDVLIYPLCRECVDKRTRIKGGNEQSSVVKVL